MATGFDNTGMYADRREAIGISAATAFASAAKSSYEFEKEFRKNMLEVATISTQVSGNMTDFMNQVMEITQQVPIKAPEAATISHISLAKRHLYLGIECSNALY